MKNQRTIHSSISEIKVDAIDTGYEEMIPSPVPFMFGLYKPAQGEESCRTDVYKNVPTSPVSERFDLVCSFKKKINMVL
jgi:hypothetical protein